MLHCRASMQGLSLTPHGKNVLGGGHIPIMPDPTFRTGPLAHVQWQRVEHMPAVVTAFGTGVPAINLGQGTSVAGRLVLQLAHQFPPPYVTAGPGEPVVADQGVD